MQTLHWQKSSYSGDSSNCLYVAATPTDTIHLRESDEPDVILTTTTPGLRALIRGLKDHSDLFPRR
ncbi:DUF397 domain-containing protein [Streptomyces aurantiogriseus]|uniref:DUF397 domain-containing protein n=1 Tax=Streptomyces aurantiogriseus TaxID=66870 RepID=UPI001677C76B|nr:DUF397 domain-containing protein [Streptomyces aurantiogriseus]